MEAIGGQMGYSITLQHATTKVGAGAILIKKIYKFKNSHKHIRYVGKKE